MNLAKLANGRWSVGIRPDLGGVLTYLRCDGRDVMRPATANSTDPRDFACFPLVPFCNRIGNARFSWGLREVQLERNFPPETHSIHGLGWQSEWTVLAQSQTDILLQHINPGSRGWPWPYRAQMRIALTEAGCSLGLILTNHSDRPMPAGLGFHPYFPRGTDTTLRFCAKALVETGEDQLPTGALLAADHFADFASGAHLPADLVDHCHSGWSGEAQLGMGSADFVMDANGLPHLHLYAPPGEDFFCLEPVSHAPDAINNAPETVTVLAPGNSAFASMRILSA